jgi:hypothetical protein
MTISSGPELSDPSLEAFADRYESGMENTRKQFGANEEISGILTATDPAQLHLLIIRICSQGVHMTRPVEHWIRRAGERCEATGFVELGLFLKGHARGEAGHDRMYANDTRALVSLFNRNFNDSLDASVLLAEPPSPGVREYQELHEQAIASPYPYVQLAIEYEIERLSLQYGAAVIGHVAQVAGSEIAKSLSFIREHTRLDVLHTQHQRQNIGKLLRTTPAAIDQMVKTGTETLSAYLHYVSDCWAWARGHHPISPQH